MCDALPNLLNICERLHPSPLRTAFLTSPALARDRLLVLLLSAGREQIEQLFQAHAVDGRTSAGISPLLRRGIFAPSFRLPALRDLLRLFLDLLSLLHPLLGLASVEMRRQTVCRELPSQARTVDRDTRTVIDERRTVDTSCVGAAQHGRDPFRFQQTAELLRGTGSTQHPHDGLPRTVERRTVPQCLPAAGVVPFECPVSYVASYTARLDRYTLWRGVVIERTVEDTGILVSVCRTPALFDGDVEIFEQRPQLPKEVQR